MRAISVCSLLAIGAACSSHAWAEVTVGAGGIQGDFGALQFKGNVTLSIQGAAIDRGSYPRPTCRAGSDGWKG